MIVGIDAGNFKTKVCGECGLMDFYSDIGEYRERNLVQKFGEDDMIFEYKGRMGFAGSLAKFESEYCGSMMGDSKSHDDAKIRILLALHKYSNDEVFDIVVGQPITKHTETEKAKIKSMLKGKHKMTVNGISKEFFVCRVEMAAEGASAIWSIGRKVEGLARIIDVGSGTVNLATLFDGRYIDKDSTTLKFGASTNKSSDLEAMVRAIVSETSKKWSKNDLVYIVGGIAQKIFPYLQQFYPEAEVIKPVIKQVDSFKTVDPIYANCIGFFQIARGLYAKGY